MSSAQFNARLHEWEKHEPTPTPFAGTIERPDSSQNLIWQTRARVPNEHELRLIAALEKVFGEGAVELNEVVAGLNRNGAYDHSGRPWSEASFRDTIAILGY